jgi:hypothetical protein
MKIYFCTIIAILIMTGTAGAQHSHIGIKAGLNITNVHHDNNIVYDYKAGLHAGMLAHIHLAKHFAIQPEVVFSMQGARYDFFNTTTQYNLNYVNVPVLFQFMFGHGFRLQAGPQAGFLVSARSENGNYRYNHINDVKPFDVGAVAGMSYVTPIGFGVDARYVHGLTSINENSAVYSTNRGAQLGVFFLFNHPKH